MHQDFKELLSAFNAGQVKCLIVGGYAVSFHAQPRATKDLDILIGADAENSKAVFAALAKFGAPIASRAIEASLIKSRKKGARNGRGSESKKVHLRPLRRFERRAAKTG
jgi:hypothetical protein